MQLIKGICTLGNDRVLDQILALLNSIEAWMGPEMPVCIYPYDDQVDQLAVAISNRSQVSLYSNKISIQKWDAYVKALWDTHPTARQRWQAVGDQGYHRLGTHRRYCAFDGPFDQFIYMDADTLLMNSVNEIFEQLAHTDFITYDFQYKDPTHVYEVSSQRLHQVFSPEQIKTGIFCSGFYATRRNLFNQSQQNWILEQLKAGDAEILYPMAPDQTLLNYMVMKTGLKFDNWAQRLAQGQKTGNSVTSTHFTTQNNILYDQGQRLTYLHYIGISSKIFHRLCQGENLDFPYRDIFLHYRYLQEPNLRPKFSGRLTSYKQTPTPLRKRVMKKLGLSR